MSSSALGILCAFLASCTWAFAVAAYSSISKEHPAFKVHFMRAALSLPLFILILFFENPSVEAVGQAFAALPLSTWGWLALSILASLALGDVLFLWSTRALGVTGALAIASTYPLWTALADVFFKGSTLNFLAMLGLILVVGGTVGVIMQTRDENEMSQGGPIPDLPRHFLRRKEVGVCLAFCTSAMWALNAYALNQIGPSLPNALGNSIRMGYAVMMAPLIGYALGGLRQGSPFLPFKILRKYGWIFFIEGFGGTVFYMYGLTHAPLAIGAALSSLAPVLVVPVALLSRTEKFSGLKTFFVLLVVVGVWLLVTRTAH